MNDLKTNSQRLSEVKKKHKNLQKNLKEEKNILHRRVKSSRESSFNVVKVKFKEPVTLFESVDIQQTLLTPAYIVR